MSVEKMMSPSHLPRSPLMKLESVPDQNKMWYTEIWITILLQQRLFLNAKISETYFSALFSF